MHMAAVMASSLMADLVKKMVAEMVVMVAVMALLTLMNRNMCCLAMQMAFMAMLENVHHRQC